MRIRVLDGLARPTSYRLTTCLSRAVILLPILSFAAAAQAPASNWDNVKMLAPGTQVRVAAIVYEPGASKPGASKQMQGTLESVTDGDLVLTQGTGPQSFPRLRIVSVSVKKNERRWRNALVGMGVGTAGGAAIGFGIGHAQCGKTGGWCGLDQIGGAGIGGIAGLIGGTLSGVFWSTGGWRKIYTL
jgi:hypothetical protein